MPNTYSVKILDKTDKPIGELMNASGTDVLTMIHKGFKAVDIRTHVELTESVINSTLGVSDGVMMIG